MGASTDIMTAVVFPGQGSQEKGMGRDLAEHDGQYMELWKLAEKASGLPLREIYWDGEAEDMADTRALQPAMTAVNLSLWLYAGMRLEPACVAGHSLGEFAALAAARVLDPVNVLELTALRGRLMAEAGGPKGSSDEGMAAILKLDRVTVEEMVAAASADTDALLVVANANSPGQFVVSGKKPALDAIAAMAKERKGRAVPLAVSGAFHSPLMDEAARDLAKAMEKLHWRSPSTTIHFNATGQAESDPDAVLETMARQMISGVRWIDIVSAQWGMGARRWVEMGPKSVLTRLLSANLKDKDEPFEALNASTMEQADALFQER